MPERTDVTVATAEELQRALDASAGSITIEGTITGLPSVVLPPGTALRGGRLVLGGRGVQVTTDNAVEGVRIEVPDTEVALGIHPTSTGLGTLRLADVTTRGQVALVARGAVRTGHVVAERVHVEAADVRGRELRGHAYGVDALQGAFTLWNTQLGSSERGASELTAELRDISAGTPTQPVRGSGVMVGGARDLGGAGILRVSALTTGVVRTDGGIAPGTADVISGGVFVLGGAEVEMAENLGAVSTFGQNDMVLDNWGVVGTWTARAAVTSSGPSGIGFVNFGDIGRLVVDGPIATYGPGSRGFNLYDGSLDEGVFADITTFGDGAVGVQVSRSLPLLHVRGDLRTHGGVGTSLVKGRQLQLEAMALSVQDGGHLGELRVDGVVSTSGDEVTSVEVLGALDRASVTGGIHARGRGGVAVRPGRPTRALAEVGTSDGPA